MIQRNDPRNFRYSVSIYRWKEGGAGRLDRLAAVGVTLAAALRLFDKYAAMRNNNGERQYAPAITAVRII